MAPLPLVLALRAPLNATRAGRPEAADHSATHLYRDRFLLARPRRLLASNQGQIDAGLGEIESDRIAVRRRPFGLVESKPLTFTVGEEAGDLDLLSAKASARRRDGVDRPRHVAHEDPFDAEAGLDAVIVQRFER